MSDERDTGRSFERAVAASLRDSLVRGGPDCPAPGLLGAYLQRGLARAELEAIEGHLSTCDACQAELAMLVRLEPAPVETAPDEPDAAIAAPEPVPTVDAPSSPVRDAPLREAPEEAPQAARPPRRAAPMRPLRWVAAPLALAATAVLGVLLTRRLAPEVSGVGKRASGVAEKPASELGARRDLDSARRERAQVAAAPSAPPPAAPLETAPATESDAAKSAPQASGGGAAGAIGGAAGGSASGDESAANALSGAAPGEPRASSEAAPAEAPAPPQQAAPPPAVAQARPEAGGALADAARAKSSLLEKGAPQTPSSAAAAPAAAPPEARIAVPGDPSIVWRVRGATIERSDDGGSTWRVQIVARSPLTTGAAVSATVCWLAGPAGTVLRTVDGVRWTRVAAPDRADVVSVSATSASSATVTLADGSRRSTADGGRSWSKP